jgi:hypothetical protein
VIQIKFAPVEPHLCPGSLKHQKNPTEILQRIMGKYATLKSAEKPKARFQPEPGLLPFQRNSGSCIFQPATKTGPLIHKRLKINSIILTVSRNSNLPSMCRCASRSQGGSTNHSNQAAYKTTRPLIKRASTVPQASHSTETAQPLWSSPQHEQKTGRRESASTVNKSASTFSATERGWNSASQPAAIDSEDVSMDVIAGTRS